MKAKTFMGVVVLGALLVIISGTSQAGEWMHKSSEGMKSMEKASGTTAPDFWTYEYWQASEAGTLASHDDGGASTKVDVPSAWQAESDPIVLEVGPFQYREVDLGE